MRALNRLACNLVDRRYLRIASFAPTSRLLSNLKILLPWDLEFDRRCLRMCLTSFEVEVNEVRIDVCYTPFNALVSLINTSFAYRMQQVPSTYRIIERGLLYQPVFLWKGDNR